MIEIVQEQVVIKERYKTSDGKIFSDYDYAKKHEEWLDIEPRYNEIKEQFDSLKIPMDNVIGDSLDIGEEIIYFKDEQTANEFIKLEEKLGNYEFNYYLIWTGAGYYYITYATSLEDGHSEINKTYKKFINDFEKMVNKFSIFINYVKEKENVKNV